MLTLTLVTLPPEILSHIFSYLVSKDITTVPPTQSLLPHYQSIIYNSVFIVKESAYTSFDAALTAKPFLAKFITKFDVDFRNKGFRSWIWAEKLIKNIKLMSGLEWLGLGDVPTSVSRHFSGEMLKHSLPRLRQLNIACTRFNSTELILSWLDLVASTTQLTHFSTSIMDLDGDSELYEFDDDQKEALSSLNFDHITHLEVCGELDLSSFAIILACFKKVTSLTLRTRYFEIDFTSLRHYSQIQELHLFDTTVDGAPISDMNELIKFSNLQVLSIGDSTLFRLNSLELLSNLKQLHTLIIGKEFWIHPNHIELLIDLILPGPKKILSLKNFILDTRSDYYHTLPLGSRWKEAPLEKWEVAKWNWEFCAESELQKLFEVARRNGIQVGGQILEVEWPELGRPRVLGDV